MDTATDAQASPENDSNKELNSEYFLTSPEDIYGALRKIILMKQPVFIKIEGSDENYTSAVTQANLKNSSFYLDQVIPTKGNELIRAGHRFSLLADSQGVKIEFNITGRLKYQPDNQQYRVEFPSQVLYLQRRTAYRVMVPPAHQILVKLKMEDGGGNLIGRLIDLSSSGFKALFKEDHVERLKSHKNIAIARIRFNQQHSLDCSIEARHVVATKTGNTQVGFAFDMISGNGQRYLDRLIGELQWEERRKAEQAAQEEQDELSINQGLPKIPQ